MATLLVSGDDFAAKLNAIREADNIRDAIIESLRRNQEKSQEENSALRDELRTLHRHDRNNARDIEQLERELREAKEKLDASPFVVVLVDGDGTLFLDEFIRAGLDGGRKAAHKLLDDFKVHLKEHVEYRAHWKICVRIFANLQGLINTYLACGILTSAQTFLDFVVGFNRELPLAEFIEAGPDREGADSKIKENLHLYCHNEQCRYTVLAGSADRGYVSALRQYTNDQYRRRVGLIESVPFPNDFKELAGHFENSSLPDVFRATKLVRPTAGNTGPRQAPSYAAAMALVNTQQAMQQISIPQPGAPSVSVPPRQTRNGLYYNEKGQRVDLPLPPCENMLFHAVAARKLCNLNFLARCNFSPCEYNHDAVLSPEEKNALRHAARQSACHRGNHCEDRNCIYGHRCPQDGHCTYKKCKFDATMHNVDPVVAKTK